MLFIKNKLTNKQQKPRVQRIDTLHERMIQIHSSSVTRIFLKYHVFPPCLFNLLSCNWFIGGWISGDAAVIERRPSLCLRVVPPPLATSTSIIPKQHKMIPQQNKMFSRPIFPSCCVLHKQRGVITEYKREDDFLFAFLFFSILFWENTVLQH